ncbi:variable surface protein Vir6, putative, partial [Plasmodium vivax]
MNWYDYYNGIKWLRVNYDYQKNMICDTLALFVKSFNEIKVDLSKNDAFYRKLEHLKELMKSERTWTTDKTCPINLNHITLKKNDPPSETVASDQNPPQLALTHSLTSEVAEGPKTDLERQDTPISGVHLGLDEASRSHTASTSSGESELRGTLELENALRPEEEFKSHLSTELDSGRKNIEMLQRSHERELVGTYTHQPFYTHSSPEYRYRGARDEETLIGNLQIPPSDQERASSSVMSTITSALKDVDPVPVVGVSGGMGALFLLFRYTPVGAFFRGGRGRVRRIPSGFHGQFLGEFPDIQDYYGGNIGYGQMNPLAE